MNIAYIIAGLVFLFNPNINIIDILPDAIGIGLIMYGFLRISRVEPSFSAAMRYFKVLFITELCKIPSIYIYSLVSSEEQLWILIMSLVFGVIEAVYGILAWKSFFEGLEKTAELEKHPNIFKKLSSTRVFMFIFTVLKPVFTILPDTVLLSDSEYGVVGSDGIVSLANYRGAFNILSAAFVLIVGIVWLISTISYINGVKKEKDYIALLTEKADSYYSNDWLLGYKTLISAFGFVFVAFIFCFELKIEGYSLVPPFIAAALFVIFFFLVKRTLGSVAKRGFIFSVIYLVLSVVSYIVSVVFSNKHYIEDDGSGYSETIGFLIENYFDVFDELILVNIAVLLSSVAFGFVIYYFIKLSDDIINEYTGAPQSLISEKEKSEAIREHEEYADKTIKKSLKKPQRTLLVIAVITAAASAIYPIVSALFYHLFAIELAIRVIFILVFTSYAAKLKEAVKVKCGLDLD